jgi:isopenicillin N synthase-like dioxygenase
METNMNATQTRTADDFGLAELKKETTIGGAGHEVVRAVKQIDLSNFAARKQEIADQLWEASTDSGFFQLINHGIPQAEVDAAFEMAAKFFALPNEVKAKYPMLKGTNSGWEFMAQVRPSTGTADRKESYQITKPRMAGLYPTEEECADFVRLMGEFESRNWAVAMQVLSCFALKMGFEDAFFTERHDPTSPEYQSTLRLLHYLPMEDAKPADFDLWRAGAHTDYDCLTLLHQRVGQGGLQVCPGKEFDSQEWTPVPPTPGAITCNIGDMLMRWSDDELQSTLHRVRMPKPDEYQGPRYSIAFFAQANRDAIVQGPKKKYEPITAMDYLLQRIAANFAKLEKK